MQRKRKIEGYDAQKMEYNGIEFRWSNLKIFHTMFMERMGESWKYDLEKEKLRQLDQLTEKAELEINLDFLPLRQEIHDLYRIIYGLRVQIINGYNHDKVQEASFKEICRTDFVSWINFFVWTRDPRLVPMGLQPDLPFVLTLAQEKAIREIDNCYRSRRDVLVEKSRAEGITELLCAYSVWHWLYTPGFQGLWASRVERLVDKIGSPGAIFPRLRRIIYGLPIKMRPKVFKTDRNEFDKLYGLENREMDTFLRGESGENIGRGDRTAIAIVDEKAHIKNPVACDEALSQATDCQIDISTPNGQDHFYTKRNSNKVNVITLWWWRNPSKNVKWRDNKRPQEGECYWYEYQLLTRDPVLIAKEIDINYLASVLGLMIPPEWVQKAVDFAIAPIGPRIAGLDIAAAGKDKSVYVTRQGSVVSLPQIIPMDTPIKTGWVAADLGKADKITRLVYDRGGLGEDIYTVLKEGERKVTFELVGVYGQQRASDRVYDAEGIKGYEKFRNGRAEWWWEMRRRFEKTYLHVTGSAVYDPSEMISLPSGNQSFLNELSSPLLVMGPDGRMGVESKKEMATRNVASPDMADAMIYSFFNPSKLNTVVPGFDYVSGQNFSNFTIDFNRVQDLYVSVFHTEDMDVYVLVCAWDYTMKRLRLYFERLYENFDAIEISDDIHTITDGRPIKMYIGNKEIFDGWEQGKKIIWYDYKMAGMALQVNWSHDVKESITLANNMFVQNRLEVHDTCDKTMHQIRNWRNVRGAPQTHLYFALCLCQILTMLQTKKVIQRPEKKKALIYNKR